MSVLETCKRAGMPPSISSARHRAPFRSFYAWRNGKRADCSDSFQDNRM
jgi:hypothetical protein